MPLISFPPTILFQAFLPFCSHSPRINQLPSAFFLLAPPVQAANPSSGVHSPVQISLTLSGRVSAPSGAPRVACDPFPHITQHGVTGVQDPCVFY